MVREARDLRLSAQRLKGSRLRRPVEETEHVEEISLWSFPEPALVALHHPPSVAAADILMFERPHITPPTYVAVAGIDKVLAEERQRQRMSPELYRCLSPLLQEAIDA